MLDAHPHQRSHRRGKNSSASETLVAVDVSRPDTVSKGQP